MTVSWRASQLSFPIIAPIIITLSARGEEQHQELVLRFCASISLFSENLLFAEIKGSRSRPKTIRIKENIGFSSECAAHKLRTYANPAVSKVYARTSSMTIFHLSRRFPCIRERPPDFYGVRGGISVTLSYRPRPARASALAPGWQDAGPITG